MWQHNYMPIGGSLALSTPVAAIPIVVLFVMLGVFRKAAWISAATALLSALVVGLVAYGMPAQLAVTAAIFGAAQGVFPIAWVVFGAIMLYRLAVDTGKFETVVAKLDPLAMPDRPFHASVTELQALAAARKNDLKRARELWTAIVKDPASPQGVQQRAQAMLAYYGPGEGK